MREERTPYPPLRLVVLEPGAPEPPPPQRPPLWTRAWWAGLLLCGAVALVAVLGVSVWPAQRAARDVRRLAEVSDPAGTRPAAIATPTAAAPVISTAPVTRARAVTFLLVGSDRPEARAEREWPAGRSDAILIARLAADRRHAQVVSIPRDAWVDVPGHGMARLNAACAWGGPRLLVRTIEQLTGTHVDHVAAVDFAGLADLVDTLGGIGAAAAESTRSGGTVFTAGDEMRDGERTTLDVPRRRGLPPGDLDRVRRHQEVLRMLLARLARERPWAGTLSQPSELVTLLRSVRVDDALSAGDVLRWLEESRGLRRADVSFLTAPVAGLGREGEQRVVRLDSTRTARLWEHLREDRLAEHLGEFAAERLPDTPR